ncbi:MAG: glycosyltransferase family 32 protein [Novosphingobium sp.]
MNDPILRRMRRVARSLTEPSGWRSLRYVSGYDSRNEAGVASPPCIAVERIVPAPPGRQDRIPPLIFQTWKSRSDIPVNYRYWRQTFIRNNPEAQVVLWDDDDNRAFIAAEFPWFLPVYEQFPREIFRADAVRYFFLFAYGGLYADMDSECLRPLRLGQRSEEVLLGRMGSDTAFEHSVPNALMASRPGQAFWLLVIRNLCDMAKLHHTNETMTASGPEQMTGPILLKRSFDEYQHLSQNALEERIAPILGKLGSCQKQSVRFGRITLLDRRSWYPLDWTNPFHKKLRSHLDRKTRLLPADTARWIFPRAELVTYWSHSW